MSARDGNLRSVFKSHIKSALWVPIESWAVSGPGIPDSHYLFKGGASGWVEFKTVKKGDRVPTLKKEQAAWLGRYARLGGRCFLATRVGDDELVLHSGIDATLVRQSGLREARPLGRFSGGPRGWNWAHIEQWLKQPPSPPPAT
jgi:hypothetical protein